MKKEIKITGMHCERCKARVEQALVALENVKNAKVNLKKACAVVDLNKETDKDVLKNAITELGFEVVDVIDKKGFFG